MLDALIEAAERIAKPSMLLSETPSSTGVVANWGGHRQDYAGREDDQPILWFDCAWLRTSGLRVSGSIGIHRVASRWKWPTPVYVDRVPHSISDLTLLGGESLYGTECRSLPPIEALCLYGDVVVERWLRSEDLDRTEYDVACSTQLGSQYQDFYMANCPLYTDVCDAVLGGWHAIWPNDEFYIPREMQLVAWTFRDAEPWYEVFERTPNFPVRVRVT